MTLENNVRELTESEIRKRRFAHDKARYAERNTYDKKARRLRYDVAEDDNCRRDSLKTRVENKVFTLYRMHHAAYRSGARRPADESEDQRDERVRSTAVRLRVQKRTQK